MIEAAGLETPLTIDEYKAKVRDLRLDIAEFYFYQDKLIAYTRQNLTEIFEKLSGSLDHKDEYERLMDQKLAIEAQLRDISEQIKEKRHEKVKVKGLGDY